MGKAKTTPGPVPSDDSKVAGTAASNVTPIKGHKGTAQASEVGGEGAATSAPEPSLVVFGRDESKKPHASWFTAADAELAARAAGLMGYQVLPVGSPEVRAAALGLAAGRIFASGKGFVPFCREAAYEALQAFPGAFAPPTPPEPEPVPPPVVTGTPQRWEDPGVGSLVLASTGPDEGWFEAVIIDVKGDSIFVLNWQGWPEHDCFVRRADGLALLPKQNEVAA